MRNHVAVRQSARILVAISVVACGGGSSDNGGGRNTVITQQACEVGANAVWQNEVFRQAIPGQLKWCPLVMSTANRAFTGSGFADARSDRVQRPAGWFGTAEMWVTHRPGVADVKQVSSEFCFCNFLPELVPGTTNVQPIRGNYTLSWTSGVVSSTGQQETDSLAVWYESRTSGVPIARMYVKTPAVISTLPGDITGSAFSVIAQTPQAWRVITDWDTSGYAYQWRVDGNPISGGASSILNYSFAHVGAYTLGVDQILADGTVLVTNQVINVPFTALLEGPGTVAPTMAAHFAASAPGGDLPYTYAWTLDNEPYNVGSVSSIDIWPGQPGTTHVIGVTIRDASGNVSFVSNSVSVLAGGSDFNRVEPVPVLLDTPAPARPKGSVGGSVARKSH